MTFLGCTIRTTGPEVVGVAGAEDPDVRSAELAAVRAGTVGRVHSWELVSGLDGPGTRLTVFLSGCVLRCQYCHNPDTWRLPDGNLTTLDELTDRIARRAAALKVMHGGVTLSGGEPLIQRPFVTNVLQRCKELGLHTALDTSGFLGMRAKDELLDAVDLVLLDVKAGLPETYRTVTGRELAPTLRFGRRLRDRGTPIWIRYVLVPGLTDGEEDVCTVADYVASISEVVQRVEVLPFHQMGRDKWKALDIPYPLAQTKPPSDELVTHVRETFRSRGLVTY
ncbi:MAG: pyruvate formate lyase-activating protein [Pseudonocardia sp.]|nr:pyruvate formate lyase-activating protein [Pseudonocardia sp.]